MRGLVLGALSSMMFGAVAYGGTPVLDGGREGGSQADAAPAHGEGGTVVRPGVIGQSCSADADCGAGLICLLASGDSFVAGPGGPAGGICSLDCSNGDDTTCQAMDPNSVCVGVDTAGTVAYCLEACTPGITPAGTTKCHDRGNMACSTGFCTPTCRGDFECGGRRCDLGTGLCTGAPAPGSAPIGARCDPSAATNDCPGGCLPISPTEGFCTGVCSLGHDGCGLDPTSSAPMSASCNWVLSGGDTGDQGFCGQLCDCNQECLNPDFVCEPLPPDQQRITGRTGFCTPPTGVSAGGIMCGEGEGGPFVIGGLGGTSGTGGLGAGTGAGGSTSAGASGGSPGTGASAALDGGDTGSRAASERDASSCGCRLPASRNANGAAMLALLLPLGTLVRRRSRKKTIR